MLFFLREVVIVDRNPADVLAKGGLDDQFPCQVKLVEAQTTSKALLSLSW